MAICNEREPGCRDLGGRDGCCVRQKRPGDVDRKADAMPSLRHAAPTNPDRSRHIGGKLPHPRLTRRLIKSRLGLGPKSFVVETRGSRIGPPMGVVSITLDFSGGSKMSRLDVATTSQAVPLSLRRVFSGKRTMLISISWRRVSPPPINSLDDGHRQWPSGIEGTPQP